MRDIVSPLDGIRSPFGQRRTLTPFNPLSLFSAGEVGAWYDPSDFSSMFQDSAGTTPVTAVEQPVGLILDKSKSLALGSELWGATSDYSAGTGTSSDVGGVITISGTDSANRGRRGVVISSLTIGRFYQITFNVSSFSGVAAAISIASGVSNSGFLTFSTTGSYRCVYVADATSRLFQFFTASSGATATIGSISIKEIAGSHASQSTSASRPVLSARVNQLTYSEQFDNAAWTKTLATIAANATTDPLGGSTADEVTCSAGGASYNLQQAYSGGAGPWVFSVYLKAGSISSVNVYLAGASSLRATFNLSTQAVSSIGASLTATSITAAGNGWYKCSITGPYTYAGNGPGFGQASGNGTIYGWGADLRVTNDGVGLPAYQRIAAATDYDTTGFPYYLRFDGTDDSLATSAIDFSATDKMSVFAGVRKLSDAAIGMVAELTANVDTNNGSFNLYNFTDANFYLESKGTTKRAASSGALTSPITNVLSAATSISGDSIALRSNGVQVGTSALDQGTGNYSSAVLYVGSRGGTTYRLNGRLYSLIIRGAQSTSTEITNAETWVNTKTKAY